MQTARVLRSQKAAPQPSVRSGPVKVMPSLPRSELAILRQKQRQLQATRTDVSNNSALKLALESTLIFAQYEAGTAVCVHPDGWILTCAHCIAETKDEYASSDNRPWLLFHTGQAVQAQCQVWDTKRDLALLRIVAVDAESNLGMSFPSVPIAAVMPKVRSNILCIGQPGRDDLESKGNRKTKYNLVEISEGRYRGLVEGADPQDNSEIGSMKHDAWTYWGHSGAPLLVANELVGLHSSWDDETAMRHGVPLVAIRSFLQENLPSVLARSPSEAIIIID